MILKILTRERSLSQGEMAKIMGKAIHNVHDSLIQLRKEGFLKKERKKYKIA
jgi:predicted transcriptional regulator